MSAFSIFDSIDKAAEETGNFIGTHLEDSYIEEVVLPPVHLGATSLEEIPENYFKNYIKWYWSGTGPRNSEGSHPTVIKKQKIRCVCNLFENRGCKWCTYDGNKDFISVDQVITKHGKGSSIIRKLSSAVYTARKTDDKYSRHEIESIEKIDTVSSIYIPPDVKDYAKSVFRTIRNYNDKRTILRGNKARALLVACVVYAFMYRGQFCSYDSLCIAFDVTKNRKAVTQAFGTITIIMGFLNEPPLQPLTPQQYISSICTSVSFPFDTRDIVFGTRIVYAMANSGFSQGNLVRTLSTFATMILYSVYLIEGDEVTRSAFKFFGLETPKDIISRIADFTKHSDTTISGMYKRFSKKYEDVQKVAGFVILESDDYDQYIAKNGLRGPQIPGNPFMSILHVRRETLDKICVANY